MALNLVSRNERLSAQPHVIKQEFMDSDDDVIMQPLTPKLTNFSISEILKPNFGLRTVKIESTLYADSKTTEIEVYPNDRRSCSSPDSVGSLSPSSNEDVTPLSSPSESDKRLWPAWVYCTRYSDRPSSGPRSRKIRKKGSRSSDDKRPRTAFSNDQLDRLQVEFENCRYLTESRRKDLSQELNLSETQIKIWFQNKRAKLKKSSGTKNSLALHLMAQGLYNHATISIHDDLE